MADPRQAMLLQLFNKGTPTLSGKSSVPDHSNWVELISYTDSGAVPTPKPLMPSGVDQGVGRGAGDEQAPETQIPDWPIAPMPASPRPDAQLTCTFQPTADLVPVLAKAAERGAGYDKLVLKLFRLRFVAGPPRLDLGPPRLLYQMEIEDPVIASFSPGGIGDPDATSSVGISYDVQKVVYKDARPPDLRY
jgi:type VI protein secretion system component Hcp